MSSVETLQQNAQDDPVLWEVQDGDQVDCSDPEDIEDAQDVAWTIPQRAHDHRTDGLTHQGKSIVLSHH